MSTLHLFKLRKESRVLTRVINRRAVEVMPKPDLTTQRLIFRTLTPSDELAILKAINRDRSNLRRWIPLTLEHETDAQFFARTITKSRALDGAGSAWRRGAFLDSGRFVGLFNLIKIKRGLEWSCHANWWVNSTLTGQGFGSEGVQAMVDFALAEQPIGLGLHHVRAHICKDNPASLRIAPKCGFAPTGRSDLLNINKALITHDEYELLIH